MIDDLRDRYEGLTERQRAIMGLYASGMNVHDCAAVYGVVSATIYAELQTIRRVFEVETNAGAIVLALAAGAMDMPGEEVDGVCRETTV